MVDIELVQFATTEQFSLLEKDSRRRNQGPIQMLIDELDPMGRHVVSHKFLHNGVEWRCCWLVKLKSADAPTVVWMDNSIHLLEKHTQTVNLPMEGGNE